MSRLNRTELQSLFQYAMLLTQHHDNAKDLLQSAVESYLRELQSGNAVKQKMAYIRQSIRHRYIDRYRHQQRWQEDTFEEQSSYDISPLNLEALHINQELLQQIWATLSTTEREILYHWAVLGLSTDEACEQLNMPRGTFLSKIHRLRKRCQPLMADDSSQGGSY